jgi:hypothetical protein
MQIFSPSLLIRRWIFHLQPCSSVSPAVLPTQLPRLAAVLLQPPSRALLSFPFFLAALAWPHSTSPQAIGRLSPCAHPWPSRLLPGRRSASSSHLPCAHPPPRPWCSPSPAAPPLSSLVSMVARGPLSSPSSPRAASLFLYWPAPLSQWCPAPSSDPCACSRRPRSPEPNCPVPWALPDWCALWPVGMLVSR